MPVPDTDNRRQCPRHQARHEICLTASLSLLDAEVEATQGVEKPLTLFGSTYDLSEEGVSLVIPLLPIDESYCGVEGRRLPITLYLPTGMVKMQVAPVRCFPINEEEPEKGFFMAAQITKMDEAERACLVKYLNTIPN